MKKITYIIILVGFANFLYSQGIGQLEKNKNILNEVILKELIEPVEVELSKTTILDGRDDSWWNTKEYWDEKELDGVRAIIFWSISDSTKVLDGIRLMLEHEPQFFKFHDETSSLLMKTSHLFPTEALEILSKLLSDYQPGMKIFAPYGDVIFSTLFERLNEDEKNQLQESLLEFLQKEEYEFYNWRPIFNVFYRNANVKYLNKFLTDHESNFKTIDSDGYYTAVMQVKTKLYGFKYYPELIQIIKDNPNDELKQKYALYAIKAIAKTPDLDRIKSNTINVDLKQIMILNELNKDKKQIMDLLNTEK